MIEEKVYPWGHIIESLRTRVLTNCYWGVYQLNNPIANIPDRKKDPEFILCYGLNINALLTLLHTLVISV